MAKCQRFKIFYFRHEVYSYNIIYTNIHNKIQCITYNDKNTISTSLKYRETPYSDEVHYSKNTTTYAHRHNLSVHDFQIVSLIIQDFWIVQIMAFFLN